jgi:hypothetical protein
MNAAIMAVVLLNNRARAVGGYAHGPKPPLGPNDWIWIISGVIMICVFAVTIVTIFGCK